MRQPEADTLSGILGAPTNSTAYGPLINNSGRGCEGIVESLEVANGLLTNTIARLEPDGLVLFAWNKQSPTSRNSPLRRAGFTGYRDDRTLGHTFWGLPSVRPKLQQE